MSLSPSALKAWATAAPQHTWEVKGKYNSQSIVYQMLCDDYEQLLDKLEEISYDDYDLEILGAAEYE